MVTGKRAQTGLSGMPQCNSASLANRTVMVAKRPHVLNCGIWVGYSSSKTSPLMPPAALRGPTAAPCQNCYAPPDSHVGSSCRANRPSSRRRAWPTTTSLLAPVEGSSALCRKPPPGIPGVWPSAKGRWGLPGNNADVPFPQDAFVYPEALVVIYGFC